MTRLKYVFINYQILIDRSIIRLVEDGRKRKSMKVPLFQHKEQTPKIDLKVLHFVVSGQPVYTEIHELSPSTSV